MVLYANWIVIIDNQVSVQKCRYNNFDLKVALYRTHTNERVAANYYSGDVSSKQDVLPST